MNTSFRILRRDLSRLLHNPFATLIMVGVCILPSLYAWFNIAANMDPYSNTQGIKVAIVNNDKKEVTDKMTLDAGTEIVKNLKENDQLGWTFTDEAHALEGVKAGTYYAAIILPEDFSSSILSILSGTPTSPQLKYYINEKKNAIAPKITATGAGTVQQEINDTFSAVAADTISNLIVKEVSKVSGSMDTMNSNVSKALNDIHKNLEEYQNIVDRFHSTVNDGTTLIQSTIKTLEQVNVTAAASSDSLNQTSAILQSSREAAGAFSTAFSQNLSDSEIVFGDIYGTASEKLTDVNNTVQSINGTIGENLSSIQLLIDANNRIIQDLQQISDQFPDSIVSGILSDLKTQNDSLQHILDTLKERNDQISASLIQVADTRAQLKTITAQNRQSLQDFRNQLQQTMLPTLNQSLDSFSTSSGKLSATLAAISPSVDQLKSILTQLNENLTSSASGFTDTINVLKTIDERICNLTTELNALESSSSYQEFLSLKGIDSEAVSEFMSSPVEVNTTALYSVKNYGSAMAPFYTNLALWVGGLILVSIFKQEVDRDKNIPHMTIASCYFGRYFLFLILGILQSIIVCLGNLLLLKVQCVHPMRFLLAGMLCSVVYVSLIYALALAFKHVGKALCVLLVILQIPGSSGTYPIEMTPEFFQKLHPLLPFSYGIDAMREAIAGTYEHRFINDLLILCIFLGFSFIIGLCLRPLLMNLNHLFDKKLSESDLMLCETNSTELELPHLSLLMRTLRNDEDMRTELTDRATRFEAGYKRHIRIGFFTILILPLIFLVLMFSLEDKIIFLVLWIISIVVLALYLIIAEYIHDKAQKQIELATMSSDEILEMMKKGHENE